MTTRLRRALRGRHRQGGAAAVELALILPVLILLAYGVIEFGKLFAQDLAMGNGAREGARFGATADDVACNKVAAGPNPDLIRLVQNVSETTFFNPIDPALSITVLVGPDRATATALCDRATINNAAACDGAADGDRVYVEMEYVRGLSIPFGPADDAFTLTGRGVFQCEYS